MDRGHLRAEQRVVFLHVLREHHTVVGAGHDISRVAALLADTQGGDEGTDTDPCGSEVVDLIDL